MAKFNDKASPSYDICSITCNGDVNNEMVKINVKGKKNRTKK